MSTNADLNLFQVDKHIRKLDADLARFEADLKEKSSSSSQQKGDSDSGKKRKIFHNNCCPTFIWDICKWGKIAILQKNCDVVNTFNCSTMSFYGQGIITIHKCSGLMQDCSYLERVYL